MATALRQLPQQQLPSQVVVPGLLDGQRNVDRLVDKWLARGPRSRGAARSLDRGDRSRAASRRRRSADPVRAMRGRA